MSLISFLIIQWSTLTFLLLPTLHWIQFFNLYTFRFHSSILFFRLHLSIQCDEMQIRAQIQTSKQRSQSQNQICWRWQIKNHLFLLWQSDPKNQVHWPLLDFTQFSSQLFSMWTLCQEIYRQTGVHFAQRENACRYWQEKLLQKVQSGVWISAYLSKYSQKF